MDTLESLKSHAYDCLANIENWQKELKVTNDKIVEVSQRPSTMQPSDEQPTEALPPTPEPTPE